MKRILLTSVFVYLISASAFSQNGLSFDGIDDHILTNVVGVTGSNARTIEARIKTTANALPTSSGGTGQKVIVDWGSTGTGQRSTFNLLFNNAIRFEVAGNGVNGNIPVNDGLWHHVAVVIDPTATDLVHLYVDGVLDVSGTPTVTMSSTTTNTIRVGRRIDNVSAFEGEMDEVRVWNVARTQAQLQANMNNELCTLPSSLILYLPMNQGIAGGMNTGLTGVNNYAPSGGTATLTSFALTGSTSNWSTGYAHGPGFILGGSSAVSNCGTYTWPANGQFYTTSGTYSTSIPSSGGCDSIISLNLTINTNQTASQSHIACGSYTWPVNGVTYTTTGIQTAIIPTSAGCDSIISLNLLINPPITVTQTIHSCGSYTWPVNGQTYTSNTTVTDTIPGTTTCDSIVTLNLTVSSPTSAAVTENSCGPYTWPLNGVVYNSSGTYVDTIPNSSGCDSVITLNLTVAPFDNSVSVASPSITANQTGGTYQWINCANSAPISGETNQSFTATTPGLYAVIVSFNGCSDTSVCTLLADAGLSEKSLSNILISPNPNTGSFVLTGDLPTNGTILVYDVQGKLIKVDEILNNASHAMQMENVNKGVYFVQIQSERGTQMIRFVKND